MKTAFIFSPAGSQAITIARLLRHYLPEVTVVGVTLAGEAGISRSEIYHSVIPTSQFDHEKANGVVIPTGAKSTRFLLEQGDVSIGLAVLRQLALQVYDKQWIIAKATRAGIPTPATWENLADVTEYPLFYKERYEQGGGRRGIARSSADVPVDVQDDLIFQEVVTGRGTYGVGFLAEQGRLLASCTHFERESVPPAGGSAVIIETCRDLRPLQYTQQLIKFINYSGWGLAEFKYNPQRDEFLFMEINAKFWASCEFSFRNEPLFLKLLFCIDAKEKPVQRLIYLDRAFTRGILFILTNIRYFVGSELYTYPGWLRRAVIAQVPVTMRQGLKGLWAKAAKES
jgi:hypothetical protein